MATYILYYIYIQFILEHLEGRGTDSPHNRIPAYTVHIPGSSASLVLHLQIQPTADRIALQALVWKQVPV